MSECKCLMASNTSLTLRKTFEFIQNYQVDAKGQLLESTLFLNINLLKTQVAGNLETRVSATNRVTGIISAVTDTNVVIIAKSEIEGKFSEYTIEYSSIIEIASDSVYINYNLYVRYMESIPPICHSKDQYAVLLELLKIMVDKYKPLGYDGVQIVYNGVTSRLIYFSELDIVKNLIIVSKIFILTLNYIGGFAMIPSCTNNNVQGLKEGKDNV